MFSEVLYEDEAFKQRQLSALLASKVCDSIHVQCVIESNVYAELQTIFFSWKDIHCISYQDTILVEQKKILVVHVHH